MSAHRWVGSSSRALRNKPAIALSTATTSASTLRPPGALLCPSTSCRRPTVLASLVRSVGTRDASTAPRLLMASTCVGSVRGGGVTDNRQLYESLCVVCWCLSKTIHGSILAAWAHSSLDRQPGFRERCPPGWPGSSSNLKRNGSLRQAVTVTSTVISGAPHELASVHEMKIYFLVLFIGGMSQDCCPAT